MGNPCRKPLFLASKSSDFNSKCSFNPIEHPIFLAKSQYFDRSIPFVYLQISQCWCLTQHIFGQIPLRWVPGFDSAVSPLQHVQLRGRARRAGSEFTVLVPKGAKAFGALAAGLRGRSVQHLVMTSFWWFFGDFTMIDGGFIGFYTNVWVFRWI
jgi:hypothetical protein